MNRLPVVSLFLVVSLSLAACAGAPAATQSSAPTASIAPGATPTTAPTDAPTDAPTSTPEPTDAPTATAEPTEAPTDAPTAAPTSAPGVVLGIDPEGGFLITPDGYSLYTFDNDSPGESSCDADCAENWPPLTLPAGMSAGGAAGILGLVSTITRADGTLQVTYNDAPLYFYAGDNAPGDTEGDGLGDVWHLALP